METWTAITMALFGLALLGLVWSVVWLRSEHKLFSSLLSRPRKFKLVARRESEKELLSALSFAENSTLEEKLLLMQSIYGRPVAISAVVDGGMAWIEQTGAWQPDADTQEFVQALAKKQRGEEDDKIDYVG